MTSRPASQVSIGDCTLDLGARQLVCGGAPVHVRAKTFAVLCHLTENAGRVIGKEEFFDRLWPGLAVTEDTLTQSIRELRKALGPAGAALLRTVPRRGYVLDISPLPGPTGGTAARRPLLVVLPFLVAVPQAGDGALVDGIVEEITHAVARFGQLRVIARHTAFQFRPEDHPPVETARRLGADYLVEGTARRIGAELQVSAALCEAKGGQQVWGETFHLGPEGFRDLPGLVAQRVVSRLTLDVERGLALHGAGAGTGDLDAYQHFVAAVSLLRQYGEGVNERGRDHLDAALRLDPGFALAHAYRGLAEVMIGGYGSSPRAVLDAAHAHVQRGLDLAPEEARCHWIMAIVRLYLRQHATAELHLRRAMELNPSDPDVMAFAGYVAAMRGEAERGLDLLRRAIELNPLHPAWYQYDLALVLQLIGRHAEALAHLQMIPSLNAWRLTRIAASHAALGDHGAAAQHIDRAMQLQPGWDPVAEFRAGLEVEHPATMAPLLQYIAAALEAWRALRAQED